MWRGQICRSCTQLVELDLSYLKLGDPPLLQLADSCTLLRKVRSSRRVHSPSTTAALDSVHGNRSESHGFTSDFDNGNRSESHGLFAIPSMGVVASHMEYAAIEQLSLECCWNVGNAGVCAVVAACTSLEALVLSGCAKLSDVALGSYPPSQAHATRELRHSCTHAL